MFFLMLFSWEHLLFQGESARFFSLTVTIYPFRPPAASKQAFKFCNVFQTTLESTEKIDESIEKNYDISTKTLRKGVFPWNRSALLSPILRVLIR